MPYDLEAITDGCYEGTTCLINKLDIRDEKELAAIESSITMANISLLEQEPIAGTFDFKHYKAIHYFLFHDLFEWAGEIRRVDMAKKGTQFVEAKKIEEVAEALFSRIREAGYYVNNKRESFIHHITELYCDINMLHPFREGNGRTERVFITQLIRNAGYDIDFGDIDPDLLMIATIQAANGVMDTIRHIFQVAIFKEQ